MKRVGHLYDKMLDKDLIRTALHCAARGKRHKRPVQRVLRREDEAVDALYDMLANDTFKPSPYTHAIVNEGSRKKSRLISKPRFFPDQVIHWCIYLTIRDWFYRRFYEISFGSIPGKGVHLGKRYVERWIRGDRKHTRYYLKMDVTKFYPSIKPDRVMAKLRRVIKDERWLSLNERILCAVDELPIGMLLSQVYANFYMTDVDYWIKQQLGAVHYIRYMDDMVIFDASKKRLHSMRKAIQERLATEGLTLKTNWQVCKLDAEPLDFMGFRFYRGYTTLRRSIMLAISRTVRRAGKAGKNVSAHLAGSVLSYLGWLRGTDTHRFFVHWLRDSLHIGKLKNAIRRAQNEEAKITVDTAAT